MTTLLEILERKLLPLLHTSLSPLQGTRRDGPVWASPVANRAEFTGEVMPRNSVRWVGKGGKAAKDTKAGHLVGVLPLWTQSRWDLWEIREHIPEPLHQEVKELGY